MTDTIFALSSGAPPAAIAVIRISGPLALDAARRLCGKLPSPRRAGLRTLRHRDEMLDRALVLTFPGPDTATGEDLAELHLHGGLAVVRAVTHALDEMDGLRPAEPGEFTRRALGSGRIDLTEAEGLADLLAAETEGQRRAAIRAAEGGIRALVEGWATRTLQLSAAIEATLDHADEDDVVGAADWVAEAADRLARDIRAITDRPVTERLHDGLRIVLAGPPNAGKSTLLNTLAGRDAAIVSPLAGTTRDRIEVPVMRDGTAYLLIDTAGLHDAPSDIVEQIGIDRARQSLDQADLVLWLDDAAPPVSDAPLLWLAPRSDEQGRGEAGEGRLVVSALAGTGIAELWTAIDRFARTMLPPPDSLALNRRQQSLARLAAVSLTLVAKERDILLVAEALRESLRHFHRITGASDTEAMLDALFGRFCIGK